MKEYVKIAAMVTLMTQIALAKELSRDFQTRDLEEFKAKGLGEAYIYCLSSDSCGTRIPQGPVFLWPEWREFYEHALLPSSLLGPVKILISEK